MVGFAAWAPSTWDRVPNQRPWTSRRVLHATESPEPCGSGNLAFY